MGLLNWCLTKWELLKCLRFKVLSRTATVMDSSVRHLALSKYVKKLYESCSCWSNRFCYRTSADTVCHSWPPRDLCEQVRTAVAGVPWAQVRSHADTIRCSLSTVNTVHVNNWRRNIYSAFKVSCFLNKIWNLKWRKWLKTYLAPKAAETQIRFNPALFRRSNDSKVRLPPPPLPPAAHCTKANSTFIKLEL